MRAKILIFRHGAAISIFLLAVFATACGDEEQEAPPGPCSSAAFELAGTVGDVDGTVVTPQVSGYLDSTTFSLSVGEVEYTPAGGDPEMRPRILTFGTNVGSPEGRELLLALDERVNGTSGGTFEIVSHDIDTFCDVNAGELCARFGLDDNRNGKLISDNVMHEGLSGTFKIVNLTSNAVAAEWEVDFGSNLSDPFDDSSGTLSGCFRAVYGNPNENKYVLK